ncbi:MAG: serine hydrolase [Chloroflexota bacterium]
MMDHTKPVGEVAARIRRIEQGLRPTAFPGVPTTRATLEERMAYWNVPGVSIAVLHDYAIEWGQGYGLQEAGKAAPVTPATLFQAASISKPVTAAAVLRLVEAGRLDLDEDVNRYLVSWKVPANDGWQPRVTLRHLLCHGGGITVHGFPGYPRGAPLPMLTQILNGETPANTPAIRVDTLPGVQFRYAGGGTTIVQQLLIDVLRQPFPDLMRETVLDPLGMQQSSYDQPLPEARWSLAASGHRGEQGSNTTVDGKWHVYPEMAAAGLWTTPTDLLRFALAVQTAKAQRSPGVLTSSQVDQMLTPQVEGQIGLGFFLDGKGEAVRFGHSGGNHGFICQLTAFVHRGQGAAVMTNSYGGSQLIPEIMQAIAREYAWPEFVPTAKQAVRVDEHVLATYVGEYEIKPGSHFHVSAAIDGLDVKLTGQSTIRFVPTSDTQFFADVVSASLSFRKTADGTVDGMIVRQNDRDLPAQRVV